MEKRNEFPEMSRRFVKPEKFHFDKSQKRKEELV